MATAAMGGEDEELQAASWLYCADLLEGMHDDDLMQVFGNYGEVTFERVSSDAMFAGYADAEAAKEALEMLSYASLRGKVCRCLRLEALEAIRRSMTGKQRLIFEKLDPVMASSGLRDICLLFGEVLDCKVEEVEEGQLHAHGFVHFASEEEASKASLFINGMQLGKSVVEVRPFELADVVLFSGCNYPPHPKLEGAAASEEEGEASLTPEDMERTVWEHFKSLQYHHMEVLDDLEAKAHRLKTLLELYEPSHEVQILVVANSANLPSVTRVLSERFESCDYEVLDQTSTSGEREAAIEGYNTGNLYVVALASEVCAGRECNLSKPASVLVNFDCLGTFQSHLYRLFKRTESSTRVHNFFSPKADGKLAMPLLKALEEAGHEIPPELLELWSQADLGA